MQLTDPPTLDKKYKHDIDVIVDRLAVKPTVKQRLTDSVETALGLAQGVVAIDFVDLDPGDPRAGAPLLGEDGLPERPRHRHRRARAATVLLQRAVGGLPGVLRAGHPDGGGPRAGRAGRREEPRRRRHRALVVGARRRLLQPADRLAGGERGLQHHACPGIGCRRTAKQILLYGVPGQVHVRYKNRYGRERSYNAKYEGVVSYIERRHAEAESDTSRERFAGYMREVPCRACHGARLKPTSLAVTVGGKNIAEIAAMSIDEAAAFLRQLELTERERQIAERVLKEINERLQVPARRRAGLPVAEPTDRQPVRRRGAADPAGHPDRLRAGRGAVRAGRAEHRAAPAGQPAADRDPGPAAGPRQHPDRGRARRGHHPDRRLGGRHRPRRGGARRPRRGLRPGGGAAAPTRTR